MSRVVLSLLLAACSGGRGDGDASETTDAATDEDWPPLYEPLVPVETLQRDTFEDTKIAFWVPDAPTGVVFIFHGTGGDADFVDFPEVTGWINGATARGLAIVSASSDSRAPARWDTDEPDPEKNADLGRLSRLREAMIAETTIDERTPVYALGFSNGATFAGNFAQFAADAGWPFGGAFVHNSSVFRPGGGAVEAPIVFVPSEMDDRVALSQIQASYDRQQGAGQPTWWLLNEEHRLPPTRFLRVAGIDAEQSQQAFDFYVENEVVDADGVRLVPIEEAEARIEELRDPMPVPYSAKIGGQMHVVFTLHKFDGGRVEDELDALLGR